MRNWWSIKNPNLNFCIKYILSDMYSTATVYSNILSGVINNGGNDAVISMVTGCGRISGEKDYRDLRKKLKLGTKTP